MAGVNPYANWPEGPRLDWSQARRFTKSLTARHRCLRISDQAMSPTSGLAARHASCDGLAGSRMPWAVTSEGGLAPPFSSRVLR